MRATSGGPWAADSQTMKALRSVSSFSAYARADAHLVQKTTTGAVSAHLRQLRLQAHIATLITDGLPIIGLQPARACAAVTVLGIATALVLFVNELVVLLHPQRVQEVGCPGTQCICCSATHALQL